MPNENDHMKRHKLLRVIQAGASAQKAIADEPHLMFFVEICATPSNRAKTGQGDGAGRGGGKNESSRMLGSALSSIHYLLSTVEKKIRRFSYSSFPASIRRDNGVVQMDTNTVGRHQVKVGEGKRG